MVEIRRFVDEDYHIVEDLYRRAFKGEHERKCGAFRWIQTHNPFKERENNYVLIFSEQKLAGYWGVMPMAFYHFGEPFDALFSQEALVDPCFRRQGLAKRLLQEVNNSGRFLVSLWHNEGILRIKKKCGWLNIGRFRPLKKIYKINNLIRQRTKNGLIRNLLIIATLPYFKRKWWWRSMRTPSNFRIEVVKRCGKEYDEFFKEVAPELGILSDRSSQTLNWKYLDIPYKEYTFLSARKEGKICGYLVLRIEDHGTNLRKGIIVDLLAKATEPDGLVFLVKRCDEIFEENNVDFAVCQVSADIFRKVLRKQGFYQSKSRSTDSLWIYNDEKTPSSSTVRDIKNWFFTYGESDGDMW